MAERELMPADPRRWRALAVLGLVQFLIVIDNTVVNVALPSIQHDLSFSANALAWIVNGYALAAGGLVLLGGRLGDLLGRRRMFLVGTALFGAASATAGAAPYSWLLVVSRFVQGTGEALASPAALSLVALLFTDRAERAKAVGIWGGLGGVGATAGVLLSGVVTELAGWRWVFFVDVPVVALALLLLPRLVDESRAPRTSGRIDALGAALVTAGLSCVVDGLLSAARRPWGDVAVTVPLAVGGAALLAFVVVQARTRDPLVPLGFFANRTRVSANVATLFMFGVMASTLLILTLYMQEVLGYSPLRTGLAYLPFCFAFVPGFVISAQLMKRLGARGALLAAFVVACAGMLLLTRIQAHGPYWSTLLPAMLVLAAGFGMGFPALQTAAMHEVSEKNAGLASGVQTMVQSLSSALGVAVFLTIGLRHMRHLSATGVTSLAATVGGYQWAYRASALVLGIGVVVALLVQHGRATGGGPGTAVGVVDDEPAPVRAGSAPSTATSG